MSRASSSRILPPFATKVVAVVRRIPKGQTRTYKQVARLAGRPKAYRAVGNIMNRYGEHITGIPCHRVVRSDGTTGGYRGGAARKRTRLLREGVRLGK